MKSKTIAFLLVAAAASALLPGCANNPITQANEESASASQISRDSRAALRSLYAQNPQAKALGNRAKGVLVFPSITKGGVVVAAQAGNGALIYNDGRIGGYYQTAAASYGLQAGVQKFGYALFLMDDEAFRNVNRNEGWEVGSSPSLVVVDRGVAGSLSTTTIDKGSYAFFFNQRGLMGGLGLQGSKITRIHPQQ
ncbi:YSC84-related protein [Luteolibacter sp. Populi]|uniref:lipid-binding SYLF domain-containing protein n=1 Tax=Luteolibacter sp. Populi TaxID=3230487 RepID=UPI003465A114